VGYETKYGMVGWPFLGDDGGYYGGIILFCREGKVMSFGVGI